MNKRNAIIFDYLHNKIINKLDTTQNALNHLASNTNDHSDLKANINAWANEICHVMDMVYELDELVQDEE